MAQTPFKLHLLSENIVEVVLDEKVYLDLAVTDAIEAALNAIDPVRKFYQLVIAGNQYIVNPEMRNAMSAGDAAMKQLAIAWVSPNEKANREQESVVAQLSMPIPIRFFTEREKGLSWLRELAGKGM